MKSGRAKKSLWLRMSSVDVEKNQTDETRQDEEEG